MARQPAPAFAAVLEQLREAGAYSPAELARQLHVSPTQVSRWRRGLDVPQIEHIERLATLFGVDREFLERLAGYRANSVAGEQDAINPGMAAMLDSERAAVEKDLSGIPPAFHTTILNAQRAARRLAIDLTNAALELTHGTGAISTPTDDELAPPELPPGQIERRVQRHRNEPLAPAFHPAVAY